MRTTRPITAIVAVAAAAITLAGCGDDPKPPPESTATSSGQDNKDAEKQAAIKDSEKTIRTAFALPGLDPYPKTLYTEARIKAQKEQIAAAKKAGQKIKGTDEVVSIETESTSWDREPGVVGGTQVASQVCVERNGRWLDKDGKDIRGDQDGKPVKPGSRAQFLVRTVPGEGEQEGTWLIDSIEEQGPCASAEG